MRVLALDTTTAAGSVALVEDNRVVRDHRGDPSRTHAERLPRDLMTLVQACGLDMAGIDLFAVASGPGSFTGLRIGIATIQGLALVHRRRVVGVSALEALAHAASLEAAPGAIVGAWMDAHRGEVFSALYRVAPAAPFDPDRLVEMEGAAVGDPGATLARWVSRADGLPALVVGDGAVIYGGAMGLARAVVAPPPIAGAIGRLATAYAGQGETVDPAGIRPLYVRRPDAEIARDARR